MKMFTVQVFLFINVLYYFSCFDCLVNVLARPWLYIFGGHL